MSSDLKVENIKHADSASNNLVLSSDGNVSITNTLSAGTIGSGVTGSGLITMFDQYYLENHIGSNGTITPWTRVTASTHSSYAPLGTGLTQSSGIFSFPETGLYHIQAQINLEEGSGGDDNIDCRLKVTTDNSTYKIMLSSFDSVTGSVVTGGMPLGPTLINCTSTTNVKFLFEGESIDAGNYIRGTNGDTDGGQDKIYTTFVAMRIGPSQ